MKFDYAKYFDVLVHYKHHMMSYSVQRILLQLITGAEAPTETLIQSAKIFFHYRFIPWECVQVGKRLGIVVPYQQEKCFDLIVGKADINYIEDVYTLMWFPYLVLFIDDLDIDLAISERIVAFINELAVFSSQSSVNALYQKCEFVPRLYINRPETLEITDEKIEQVIRLYTRTDRYLKLTSQAADYYNLHVQSELMDGYTTKIPIELFSGSPLPRHFDYCDFLTDTSMRHGKTPVFVEMPQVTWTIENADSLKIVPFRPKPTSLLDALEKQTESKLSNLSKILEIYFFVICNAEFLNLYPITLVDFIKCLNGTNTIIQHVFLALFLVIKQTVDKDKFPLSNSQKYIDTDKPTAMIIKEGDINMDYLKRAQTILAFPIGEKKYYKFAKYLKIDLWIFSFSIFLREFVDIEQVPDILIIMEHLFDISRLQVDGQDDGYYGPNRAITRSMEGTSRRSSSESEERYGTRTRLQRPTLEEPKFESRPQSASSAEPNLVENDANVELAHVLINRFYGLPMQSKLQMMTFMISHILLSREFSLFMDKSVELLSISEAYLMRHEHLYNAKLELKSNLEKQIEQLKLTQMQPNSQVLEAQLNQITGELIIMDKELKRHEKTATLKNNQRVTPLGTDRFQTEYYFIDNLGGFSELSYTVGMIILKGINAENVFDGKDDKIPSSSIPHYCYTHLPEEYQLDIPKGMDNGKTKGWMCYTEYNDISKLTEWLQPSIPQELQLKRALERNMSKIKQSYEARESTSEMAVDYNNKWLKVKGK